MVNCTATRPRRAFCKRPPAPRKPKGKPGQPFFGARRCGGPNGVSFLEEEGTALGTAALNETTKITQICILLMEHPGFLELAHNHGLYGYILSYGTYPPPRAP